MENNGKSLTMFRYQEVIKKIPKKIATFEPDCEQEATFCMNKLNTVQYLLHNKQLFRDFYFLRICEPGDEPVYRISILDGKVVNNPEPLTELIKTAFGL